MASITQHTHLITLSTALGEDALVLTGLEGTEAVSSLFSFSLSALSDNFSIPEKSIVGTAVTCHINIMEKPPRFFHGYVRQFTRKDPWIKHIREYHLEIVPWLWFLTLSNDCRIFQHKSTLDICEELFKQFGFSDYTLAVTNTYAPRPYCVQYNESAFHFLSRLLEEEGIYYFFKHEDGKHTLVLSDLIAHSERNPSKEVSFSQGSLIPHHITQWEHIFSYCSGEFAHTDYDYTKPTVDLLTTTKTVVDFPNIKKYTHFTFPGHYVDKGRGSTLSRIHMEAHEQQHDVIQGRSNLCQFCPGTSFSLTSTELSTENGLYWIRSVTHSVKDETHKLHDKERSTSVYSNAFTCMPTTMPYRPPLLTPKPRIKGLQLAVVVGPAREEIYTDTYGRIKVQFIWDRLGKKDKNSSCWLRVAQTWAGQKWGAHYIPRVGQEVIVDFLDGDPDAPVVIGSLYNAQNMPPYDLPDNQTQSGIKSHSTPNGEVSESNEIRFEDKKGDEEFFVHAQKDFIRTVEHDDTHQVLGKQDITIKLDRTRIVEEGDDVLNVKKGKQTLTIKDDRTRVVEQGNDSLCIQKGNQTVTLTSGNQTIQLSGGNRETQISMGHDTIHLQQGNHSLKLDLGKSSIEAMQGISLTVGGNSLKIDQTGITLQGVMIKVNGKLIQLQADALMQIKGGIVMIN